MSTRKTWSSDFHGELRRRYLSLSPSPTRTPYYTANPSPEPQSDPETDDEQTEKQPISMAGSSRLTLDLPAFSPQFQSTLQLPDEDDNSHDDHHRTNLHLNINFNVDLDFSQATLGHSRPPSPAPTADFSMISPPNSPSYARYHSQSFSPPHGRNTLPFFRTSPTRSSSTRPSSTHTHLRSHSIGLGSGKRRVRPNITKLWESISSQSPRSLAGSKSSLTLKHPFPVHKPFPRSSPNLLRGKRKSKRPSAADVFGSGGSGARVSGDSRYAEDVDYGTLDPLDGEEGELVDHDGYFDAIEGEVTASPSSYTSSRSLFQSYTPSPTSHSPSTIIHAPWLPRPDTPSQAYTLCRTSLSPYASASTSTFTSTSDCHSPRTSLPLPPELTLHILSLLPVRSVLACMLVSRAFYALARDNGVWWGVWQGKDGRPRVRARMPRPFGGDAYSYPYAHNFTYELGPSTSMSSYSAFPHGDFLPSLSSSSEEDSNSDSSSLHYIHPGIRDEGVHGFPLLEDAGDDGEGDGPSGWAVNWGRVGALWQGGQSKGVFVHGDRSETEADVDDDAESNVNGTLARIPSNAYTIGDLTRRGTALGPLRLNWHTLYRSRATLERRWRDPRLTPQVMRIEGHGDSVYCLDFDSRRIVTGSRDRTIKVWCIRTGECLATFEAHLGSVLCLKFEKDFDALRQSPGDGEEEHESHGLMVSGSSDCTVRVWDLCASHGGSRVRADVRTVLRGHSGGVLDLRMDEKWIVSCSKDALINVYSRSTLTLHAVLRGHEGPVNAIGLEGGRVVSASGDGRMMLWDAASGRCERVFEGHERGLACIEFKDDLILSGSNDCTIKLWRASTGECLHTFAGHTLLVRALCFDPRTGYVVSASYDRSVRVWEWKEPCDPDSPPSPFSSSPSSTRSGESSHEPMYAGDTDGASVVGVADGVVGYRGASGKRGTGRLVREFRDLHASHIFDVKFDVGRIVSTSHDQKIVVLDFTHGIEGAEIFM